MNRREIGVEAAKRISWIDGSVGGLFGGLCIAIGGRISDLGWQCAFIAVAAGACGEIRVLLLDHYVTPLLNQLLKDGAP